MSNLSFQYPAWMIIFCVLLGLGYAALLYFRDTTFKENYPNLSKWLALLRFLTVSTLAILLLSPILKSVLTETKKPVVVIAQDASESAAIGLDGTALEAYKTQFSALTDALKDKYEVHTVSFGDEMKEELPFTFEQKVTNITEALDGIEDTYSAQNLGAIVLATDGIYNEGSNPMYSKAGLKVPIYTIALGDTTPRKDLVLKRVFHNKIAYLGDKFTTQVDIAATNCMGSQVVLTVAKVEGSNVTTVQQLPLNINKNDFFLTKEIILEASTPGTMQYVYSLTKLGGEFTTNNNSREIFVEVLDARQKILILANGAHPDISAIRQTLDLNKNYQVTVAYASDTGTDYSKFDFVALHNLPSATNDINGVLNTLNNNKIPRLFIAGAQAGMSTLAKVQSLINIQSDGRQTDEVNGKVSPQFAAFTLDAQVADQLPKYAPAISPFGTFTASPQAQVLLYKRIGKVDTQQPLMVVGETNGIKTGVLLAEGIWKWRMFNFMQSQNHEIFDELMGKTIQYLTLKEDKRKFRVNLDKSVFNENEPIVFNAELYNDNFELINDTDVSLVIKNKDGKDFPFNFNKQGKGYVLNAGIFPAGAYTYTAQTTFNGQKLDASGKFSIKAIEMELFNTVANHDLLRTLSEKSGGKMVLPAQASTLADDILNKTSIKPVIYETTKTRSVINLKWIFAILAFLLGAEWFLRRYYGAY